MKSLFLICLLLVFYGTAGRVIREYFYVPQLMSWTSAQNYCRQHYWDLATITTEEENQRVKEVNSLKTFIWIGYNRTEPHAETWQWSDGEETNFTHWYPGEPNDFQEKESCALVFLNRWIDYDCDTNFPSICYRRFTFVEEKKSWEEALQHCRTHYSYLVIVDSQKLQDLFETDQAQTDSVWTGLRFLDGKWFWVNGVPMGSLVSLPQCPIPPYRCGAYNFNTNIWENRDCNEKLNFLCYG